jgi:hypothetical protein
MITNTVRGLRVRRLADKSKGTRIKLTDPHSGETHLMNPANSKVESWPDMGWIIESDAHKFTNIPVKTVREWVKKGFAVLKGERLIHAPGGSVEDPWKATHTFVNADAIVLKCVDGEVTYKVIHQPGKYDLNIDLTGTPKGNVRSGRFDVSEKHQTLDAIQKGAKSRVDWFFGCELESDTRPQMKV